MLKPLMLPNATVLKCLQSHVKNSIMQKMHLQTNYQGSTSFTEIILRNVNECLDGFRRLVFYTSYAIRGTVRELLNKQKLFTMTLQ